MDFSIDDTAITSVPSLEVEVGVEGVEASQMMHIDIWSALEEPLKSKVKDYQIESTKLTLGECIGVGEETFEPFKALFAHSLLYSDIIGFCLFLSLVSFLFQQYQCFHSIHYDYYFLTVNLIFIACFFKLIIILAAFILIFQSN